MLCHVVRDDNVCDISLYDILYIFMILFSFDALCLHDHDVVSGCFLCSLLLVCDFVVKFAW